jgi:hypothetical protein
MVGTGVFNGDVGVIETIDPGAETLTIRFDDREADYAQEQLDRALREVWGDELETFYERYPYLKKMNYVKAPKSWK